MSSFWLPLHCFLYHRWRKVKLPGHSFSPPLISKPHCVLWWNLWELKLFSCWFALAASLSFQHGGRCLEQGSCPRAICFAYFSHGTAEEEVWNAFFFLSGEKTCSSWSSLVYGDKLDDIFISLSFIHISVIPWHLWLLPLQCHATNSWYM